ncbi:MAG: tetratricopeptide repeat protein [Candidatus Omnitrophica bacterium]|nr:tetratricopeptide repeat protein [Candidatus Omnitrophota bacterium]
MVLFSLPLFNSQLPVLRCEPKEDETLFVAKKAFEDGFYEVSLGLLKRFLRDYPYSNKITEANLLIGEVYFHQDKYSLAIAQFEDLIKQSSAKRIEDAAFYWLGETYFKENNFQKAAGYYKNIIEEFSNSPYTPLAYYSLGWCLFQEDSFEEAFEFFKVVEERYPKEPQAKDASFKIAECLYNLKDYSALKEKIKPYLKIFTKDNFHLSYLYFYLGEAEYYLNDFNKAQDAYFKALAYAKDEKLQSLSKLGLSWSYLKLKRYQEAESTFSEIKEDGLEKRSRDVLLLGKAMLMMDTNRVKEARKLYDELLMVSVDQEVLLQAYIGGANSLYNLGEYKEAIRVSKEALVKLRPQDLDNDMTDKLRYIFGLSLLKEGELKGAMQEFQKIAKPGSNQLPLDDAYYAVGLAYFQGKDYKVSREHFEKFRSEFKNSILMPKVLYLLGLSLYNLGEYGKAIDVLKEVSRSYAQDIELAQKAEYEIADCFYQLGNENEALARFKSLRLKYPDSAIAPDVIWWLGGYYYQHNDANLARRYFSTLINDFPKSDLVVDAYYALGTSFAEEGRNQEAIENFKKALGFNQTDFNKQITIALAGIFFKTGDYDQALKLYYKALVLSPVEVDSDIQFKIAETLEANGKLDQALVAYLKLSSGDPENKGLAVRVLLKIAQIYEDREEFKEAVSIYKRIIVMDIQESKYAKERLDSIKTRVR